jgi:hypothetical protein
MPKKRIAVVGKGTAGSQSLIHFARFFPNDEVVWYFDPNKPTQAVGEGSALEFPRNLYNNLGFFHNDLKAVNGNFKTGIYKENWGTTTKSFFHHFPPPNVAYHFNAVELQDYIYNLMKDKVTIVEDDVDYKTIDADFILNASGKPSSLDQFEESRYIPVNAAHVVQCKWDYPRFDYTLAIAGKHGWIFGIPLQNRCSVGYIYNKDISSEDDLQEDLDAIFKEYGLIPSSEPNRLSFNNYYRKENYEDFGRIAHNGNASFFLEPLEATSVGTMDRIQRTAFDIWNLRKSPEQANQEFQELMHQTELILMLHYAAGSPFKTKFWEFAKERGLKKIEDSKDDYKFRTIYNISKQLPEMRFAPTADQISDYGPWWAGSFSQNLRGLGLFNTIDGILSN